MGKHLEGKVAVITGGSRGIGRDIALKFASEGCSIVVAAKSTESTERLPGSIYSVAEECEKLGVKAFPVVCNVRDPESIDSMAKAVLDRFGHADIVVNNAGALWWKPMIETDVKKYNLVHEVNSRGTYLVTRAFLPGMIAQKWGHIIMMSPPIDLSHVPGRIAYFISKFGMTLIAHGLAGEVREHNIAANALWPVTIIESQATINFGLGGPRQWRKGTILADAAFEIVRKEPRDFTGHALLDEDFLRSAGQTDFDQYKCVPDGEPQRIAWMPKTPAGVKTNAAV
ncbi:MAG: SDR family oxidoreductase [Deltaproteobacteria bacterium]|nr:SDR family oxidoreductase [Deltaproteobacteria bacterium]